MDKLKENSSWHILTQVITMDKFIMVKSLVKTDNITVHSSNMLVASKIAYIMEKEK